MARIITTVGGGSSSGVTTDQVLALIQANTGYEYIKFVSLNGTVSQIDITNLDTNTYTGFRLICTGLNQGGSGAQNGYFQIGYGNVVDSGNRYNNSWFAMPQTTNVSYGGSSSSYPYWFASSFGDGGSGYTWNPQIDLTFSPTKSQSDAQIWITVNAGTPYYNGNLAGSHVPLSGGSNINMLRIYGGNTLTGSSATNSGVHVFGIRKRS